MRPSSLRARSSFLLAVALGTASSAVGCDAKQPAATPPAASPQTTAGTAVTLGAPTLTTRFDAKLGELPEGLVVIDDGAALVGFAPSSKITRVDLASGSASPFGTLPAPVSGKGFMTGLARGADGTVFAGLASFVPEVQAGVYRVPRDGGAATLVAKDAAMPFPNALTVDPRRRPLDHRLGLRQRF